LAKAIFCQNNTNKGTKPIL